MLERRGVEGFETMYPNPKFRFLKCKKIAFMPEEEIETNL